MGRALSFTELGLAVIAIIIATLLVDSEGVEILLEAIAFILIAAWLLSVLQAALKKTGEFIQASVVALSSGGFSYVRETPDGLRLATVRNRKPPRRKPRPLIVALSSGGFNLIRRDDGERADSDGQSQLPPGPPPGVMPG